MKTSTVIGVALGIFLACVMVNSTKSLFDPVQDIILKDKEHKVKVGDIYEYEQENPFKESFRCKILDVEGDYVQYVFIDERNEFNKYSIKQSDRKSAFLAGSLTLIERQEK